MKFKFQCPQIVLSECSQTHGFRTVYGYLCATVGRLSSCYRNRLWHSHRFTFLLGKRMEIRRALCICTTTVYYFLSYPFISIMSQQENCTFHDVPRRHTGVWIILPHYMGKYCLLCNDTVTMLKNTIYVDKTTPSTHHNIPNYWGSNNQKL